MHLRGTATFRPVSPVVFVQVVEGSTGCEALERSVRSGVLDRRSCGSTTTRTSPSRTRCPDEQLDAAFAGLADFDASFVVDSFHSYAHGDDGVWRPARDFTLTGPPADAGVGTPT